jgi:hypothetical protein
MLAKRVTLASQFRGTSQSALAPLVATRRKAERARCWCPSRRRRPNAQAWWPRRPRRARPPSRTRLSQTHPPIFFSAPPQPLEHPGDRRVAHRNPAHPSQELTSLRQGRRWALFEIRFQQPPWALLQLWVSPFGWLRRSSFLGLRSRLSCAHDALPSNTVARCSRLIALLTKGSCEQLDLVGLRERRGSASRSAGG